MEDHVAAKKSQVIYYSKTFGIKVQGSQFEFGFWNKPMEIARKRKLGTMIKDRLEIRFDATHVP
mgnify:CR=1 FL=1